MNNSKRLSQHTSSQELLWGSVYFVFYLVALPSLIALLFEALGWEYASGGGTLRANVLCYAISFVFVLVIFHRFLWKNLGQIGKRFWGFVQAVILGWVMYQVGAYLATVFIVVLRPTLQNFNNNYFALQAGREFLLTALCTVLLAPTVEECFFRGILFQGVHKKSRVFAYALSTLAFALVHVVGYLGAYGWADMLLVMLQYIPAGIALGWAYEKADTIFAPILIHTIINAISMGAYAL